MLEDDRAPAFTFSPQLVQLAGAADVSLFWDALTSLIRETVDHHTAFLWYDYFDFANTSKSTLVLESPQRERAAEYWELRRRAHLSPAYLTAHPGLKLHRLSDIASESELQQTQFYREFMEPEGWRYSVTLSFWEHDEVRATLVLYRTAEQGDFTPAQLAWLQHLHPFIQAVLFRLIQQQQQQALQDGVEEFIRGLPVGLILLNWDLRPVLVNDEGYKQAHLWNEGKPAESVADSKADFHVPRALKQICQQFRQHWLDELVPGQIPAHTFEERVHYPRRPELRAVVSTQHVKSVSPYRPIFLIRLANTFVSSPLELAAPTKKQLEAMRLLSPMEKRVTLLVLQGLSNQEIARILQREVSTIKDHLYHIFGKLGLKRRTQLARLLTQ